VILGFVSAWIWVGLRRCSNDNEITQPGGFMRRYWLYMMEFRIIDFNDAVAFCSYSSNSETSPVGAKAEPQTEVHQDISAAIATVPHY
jgi:hypothetical protein